MVAMRDRTGLEQKKNAGHDEDKAGARGSQIVARVKDGASDVARQLKRGAGAIGQTVREEGEQLYEKQKDRVVSKVRGFGKVTRQVAHAVRAVKADGVAEYADTAAGKVDEATQYLEESDLETVLNNAGDLAREHQALVAGGLLLTGFAVSRFLKASRARPQEHDSSPQPSHEDEEGE
jgi:hypothetical protein